MMRFFLIVLLFFCLNKISSQVLGVVVDGNTKEPIIGAKVICSDGNKLITSFDGEFRFNPKTFPITIVISMLQYETDTLIVSKPTKLIVKLQEPLKNLETVVVSAGRRKQNIEEVSISMEILKSELIDNKGFANLEQVVDQSPGVYAMDGNVSIRGGGGYAYGAGSRVLLLWNGIPMVSPDVGDAKWNAIPMEQASQIEIIKGASSVLYGSGALNGIISLQERQPKSKGEFRFKFQSGMYGTPSRQGLHWWTKTPVFHLMDAYYGKMNKKVGITMAINGFKTDGYKDGETEQRGRVSGTFYFKPWKGNRLKTGVGYNFQYEDVGAFILWQSDSLGYTPLGGSDPNVSGSTITNFKSIRLNVDPYATFYDKFNNRHTLKTRYYLVTTGNATSVFASSKAEMYYSDYQFQRKGKNNTNITAGITSSINRIISPVFKDHNSKNFAMYGQYEKSWDRFDLTAGLRAEYFRQDSLEVDSKFVITDNLSLPFYPVIRAGLHYKLTRATHLRASFGQGIRFPSVAERFVATSVGGVIIFPNPEVKPEIGWSSELGIKQIFRMGDWRGALDIAAFINQYSNMMEFTFGLYKPDSIALSTNPDDIGYINNWIGFQSQNAEQARITGLEVSFNSEGKIKQFEITSLLGYTYMNPVSLNTSQSYLETFSDTSTRMLKYRFNHLAKADIQIKWKKIAIGFSSRYNSFMSNIDAVFENGLFGQEFLVGLKEYRKKYNKGALVFDTRAILEVKKNIKLNFIVNNVFNREYVSRPADIQPPRTFIVQLQFNL